MAPEDLDSPAPNQPVVNSTFATNPGRVRLHAGTYFACYPAPLFGLILLPVGAAMLFIGEKTGSFPPWLGLIVIFFSAAPVLITQQRMSAWMASGDTCPAVVLDPQSGLIAVWAEMSSTPYGSVPAIKILTVPLRKATGRPFQRGQRLTTVCTFDGALQAPHWNDVAPVPVVCATNSQATVKRSLDSVPDEQWQCLMDGLRTMSQPFTPGLYFLQT